MRHQVSSSISSQLWSRNSTVSSSTLRTGLFPSCLRPGPSPGILSTCPESIFAPSVSDILAISSLSTCTVGSVLHSESEVSSGKCGDAIRESFEAESRGSSSLHEDQRVTYWVFNFLALNSRTADKLQGDCSAGGGEPPGVESAGGLSTHTAPALPSDITEPTLS